MAIWDDIIQTLFDLTQTVDNLADGIKAGIESGLDALMDDLTASILDVSNQVGELARDIETQLSSVIHDLQNKMQESIEALSHALSESVSQVEGYVSQGLDYILSVIQAITQGLSSMIEEGLSSVSSTMASIIDSVTNTITSIQSEIDQTVSSLGEGLEGIVGSLTSGLTEFRGTLEQTLDPMNIIEPVHKLLKGFNESLAGAFLERVQFKRQVVERIARGEYDSFTDIVRDIADPPDPHEGFSGFGDLISVLIATVLTLPAMSEPYARPNIQKIERHLQNAIHSPEALAAMEVQSIIEHGEGEEQATYSGLNAQRYQQLVDLAGSPPGLETTLQLLNRGKLTEEEARKAILESRLKPKYTEAALSLREVIPPVQDVIQFAVKDAYDPEAVARFTLLEQLPEEAYETLQKLGLSHDWFEKYWASHWRLPSPEQVFEMLWRAPETNLTEADVDKYLKTQDYPPFWRDKLKAIAYKVLTRVDIRRMYKVGVLDKEGVKRAYQDMGVSPRYIDPIVDFTLKLEDETGGLSPDSQERRLWSQAVDLYLKGARSLNDLEALAHSYGWGESAIKNELKLAEWRLEEYKLGAGKEKALLNPEALDRRLIDETVNLYIKGHRPLDAIAQVMREFDIDEDTITQELLIANLRKEGAKKPDKVEELRDLSINAILDALELHALTEDEAKSKLIAIGLSEHDSLLEIEVTKLNSATKLKNSILSSLRSAYLASLLSEPDLRAKMQSYGFPPTEIENYIGVWSIESSLKHKTLSEAQLAAMLKKGVITLEEYVHELKLEGYNEKQLTWLSELRGAT